jgi:hypothetical protein
LSLELHRQVFADNVKQLAGGLDRSVLIGIPSQENKTGETIYIDGIKGNDAIVEDTKTIKNRKNGVAAYTDYLDTRTPYTGTVKERTLISPQTITATDYLGKNEDVLRGIDIAGPSMAALMREFRKKEDLLVLNALGADSVTRETDNGVIGSVTLPTSQKFETANVGWISVNDLCDIDAKFRDVYITEERYLVVNPAQVSAMKKNDRDYFLNVDFIGRVGAMVDGNIEKAEGFTILISPMVPAGEFYAFTKSAVTVNTFQGLDTSVDTLPEGRFQTQLYVDKVVNVVRNDDYGFVRGTVKAS